MNDSMSQISREKSSQPHVRSVTGAAPLLHGMWQLAGGHGAVDPEAAVAAMMRYFDAGHHVWDMADIYGPAEEIFGTFRRRLLQEQGHDAVSSLRGLTKWVPLPGSRSDRAGAAAAIDKALERMAVDTLDLVQFHWWDYSNPGYLDALAHLRDERRIGRVRAIGLTNFDTTRTAEIINAGTEIVSNQVQYSLVDLRPEAHMVPLCKRHGVGLLTYGTLCGGLLSDEYLGIAEPKAEALNTTSLRKYKKIVDLWGGWDLFQTLLRTLRQIADGHGVSIANVAVRVILDRPAVAGVIIGARLGTTEHIADNAAVLTLKLTDADLGLINEILNVSRDLMEIIGDCGDEYRQKG